MMENHSYDNKLGMLRRRGADGFRLGRDGLPLATNPYANGDIQHAFRMPTTCQLTGAPAQDWLAQPHPVRRRAQRRLRRVAAAGRSAMGYWEQADQPFYYSLASVFPIADRYFCSVLGQTYPNRRYLISATSIGKVNDTLPALTDYPAGGTIFDKVDRGGHQLAGLLHHLATVELYPELYLKNAGHERGPDRRLLHRRGRGHAARLVPGRAELLRPSPRRTRRTSSGARRSPRRSSTRS